MNKKFRLTEGNDFTYNFWTRRLRSSIEVDFCQSMTGVMGKAETPEYKSSDAPCVSMIITRITRVGWKKSSMKIGFFSILRRLSSQLGPEIEQLFS